MRLPNQAKPVSRSSSYITVSNKVVTPSTLLGNGVICLMCDAEECSASDKLHCIIL